MKQDTMKQDDLRSIKIMATAIIASLLFIYLFCIISVKIYATVETNISAQLNEEDQEQLQEQPEADIQQLREHIDLASEKFDQEVSPIEKQLNKANGEMGEIEENKVQLQEQVEWMQTLSLLGNKTEEEINWSKKLIENLREKAKNLNSSTKSPIEELKERKELLADLKETSNHMLSLRKKTDYEQVKQEIDAIWDSKDYQIESMIYSFKQIRKEGKKILSECDEQEEKINSFEERVEELKDRISRLRYEPVEVDDELLSVASEVGTFNCSAYCGCYSCSEGYNTRTASGTGTHSWCTIAASSGYPFGTRFYIPYFKDYPNGGWFTVQDRGGAIKGNKLDIFMVSHSQCNNFGRRNLTAYVFYP